MDQAVQNAMPAESEVADDSDSEGPESSAPQPSKGKSRATQSPRAGRKGAKAAPKPEPQPEHETAPIFDDFEDDPDEFAYATEFSDGKPVDRPAAGAHRQPSTVDREPEKFAIPRHLESLMRLPGIEREDFESVNPRTSFIDLECMRRRHGTLTDSMPLGHLAPDAVEVLKELGFTGHVRAKVWDHEPSPTRGNAFEPAFYCAFRLPPGEDDEESAGSATEDLILAELADMRRQMAETGKVKPIDVEELAQKAVLVLGAVGEGAKALKQVKKQILDLIPPTYLRDADPGGEDDGGGDLAATMQALGSWAGKIWNDPTVQGFIRRATAGGDGGGKF